MNLYDFCGTDNLLTQMMWRSAFLAKIYGLEIPENITVNTISESERTSITAEPYSDELAHLLILYGAGFVDLEFVKLFAREAPKYRDEIMAAEGYAIRESTKEDRERVSDNIITDMFLCTVNSKNNENMQPITFDIASQFYEGEHTAIRKEYVFPKTVEFMKLLAEAGEPFGVMNDGNIQINHGESITGDLPSNDELSKKINSSEEDKMPDVPFILNLMNAYYIQKICGKSYAAEFVKYAKAENIPFDDNFKNEYDSYIRKNKLQLKVSVISRKRDICGEQVNWFDYCTTKNINKQIVIDKKFDFSENVDLTGDFEETAELTDNEIIKKALETVKSRVTVTSVIELTFDGKKLLYMIDGDDFREIDSDSFREIPFDYNNVWTTVMEWSRSKVIQKKGDKIIIPESELNKLPKEDQPYAARMIAEQYALKKSGNKMLQKLSDLSSYATTQIAFKGTQAAYNEERENSITEENDNEGSGKGNT